jgi:hypothetical protein
MIRTQFTFGVVIPSRARDPAIEARDTVRPEPDQSPNVTRILFVAAISDRRTLLARGFDKCDPESIRGRYLAICCPRARDLK